ncbi:hypothetical protein ANCCAN_04278 [Ancylostoma caninum]|uniref:Uncharacterized protein n=1 Tax=Ancylostoma caninum TaxID=29170 RepID=A0A368GZ93_ANCCA|nr:hypothetical protein ANCCAN_04278 [Ancylostoma caninum]
MSIRDDMFVVSADDLTAPFIERVIIGSKQLVTGVDSVLGISVLLKENDAVSCGHFEPLTERVVAVAKFEKTIEGYVKMTQHGTSNWAAGIPTEIYYSLHGGNESNANNTKIEMEWQFVTHGKTACSSAPVYNPFRLNGSCSRDMSLLCAVGDAYKRSAPLLMNTRQHLVVNNLPLSGPYSILNTSLRIRKKENNKTTFECVPLQRFSEVGNLPLDSTVKPHVVKLASNNCQKTKPEKFPGWRFF